MAAKSTDTKTFQIASQYFIDELRSSRFCDKLNLSLKSENPTNTGVWYRFHHGVTMASWGEKITVTVTPLGPNTTQVIILSECGMPTQVIDWGKNRSIVCNLFEHLEKYVPERVASQPPVAPVAEPMQEVCMHCGNIVSEGTKFCNQCGNRIEEPKAKFCKNCGKQVSAGAAFCSNCGTRM